VSDQGSFDPERILDALAERARARPVDLDDLAALTESASESES
jgi:hypothetical protein